MCLSVPGKVMEVFEEQEMLMARVDFGGISKEVCLEHARDAQAGDYVLVHVGFALSRLDETEAQRVFALLRELGEATFGEEEARALSG